MSTITTVCTGMTTMLAVMHHACHQLRLMPVPLGPLSRRGVEQVGSPSEGAELQRALPADDLIGKYAQHPSTRYIIGGDRHMREREGLLLTPRNSFSVRGQPRAIRPGRHDTYSVPCVK